MATLEADLSLSFSRKDFLIPFAKKRRQKSNQPPKRSTPPVSLTPPPPPEVGFKFGRRMGIVVGGIGIAGIAAGILRPWEWFGESRIRESWNNTSPKERITRLEFKQYPQFADFNPTMEMTLATAQHFCSRVGCRLEDLTKKVFLTDTQRIVAEIEFDNEREFTPEEKEKYGRETVEMFSVKKGLILINEAHLIRETNTFIQQGRSLQQLQGRDPYAVMLKSTLFHAYTHSIVQKEGFPIAEIIVPGQTPSIYNRIEEGFIFVGKKTDGSPISLRGANEAVTEYIATGIGQDAGPYLSGSAYTSGVRLVEMLNIRANVPFDDFKDYYSGKQPKRELFRRWGALKNPTQPAEQAAMAALLTIGLRVDYSQSMSQEQAITTINGLLKP